ncbi:MAG: response regulator [bacterium]
MKVFIADESISFRSILSNSLKDLAGAEIVGHTEDCNEAIFGIMKSQPDIVIVNIRLKGGTGMDVLDRIVKTRNASPIAIMMTNYPYNQNQRMQLSHGAEYFLHKATQYGEIISLVKNLGAAKSARSDGWLQADARMCYN